MVYLSARVQVLLDPECIRILRQNFISKRWRYVNVPIKAVNWSLQNVDQLSKYMESEGQVATPVEGWFFTCSQFRGKTYIGFTKPFPNGKRNGLMTINFNWEEFMTFTDIYSAENYTLTLPDPQSLPASNPFPCVECPEELVKRPTPVISPVISPYGYAPQPMMSPPMMSPTYTPNSSAAAFAAAFNLSTLSGTPPTGEAYNPKLIGIRELPTCEETSPKKRKMDYISYNYELSRGSGAIEKGSKFLCKSSAETNAKEVKSCMQLAYDTQDYDVTVEENKEVLTEEDLLMRVYMYLLEKEIHDIIKRSCSGCMRHLEGQDGHSCVESSFSEHSDYAHKRIAPVRLAMCCSLMAKYLPNSVTEDEAYDFLKKVDLTKLTPIGIFEMEFNELEKC